MAEPALPVVAPIRSRRHHLVELEDLSICPTIVRDAATAYLEFVLRVSGHGALLAPRIADALRKTRETRIVDLCSGGGGPIRILIDLLQADGVPATATLTDLYPNLPSLLATARASGGRIVVRETAVDATDVPADLPGLRVLFNAFHHFRPADARRILADAVRRGAPIAVFEVVSREPAQFIGLLFSPLFFCLALPFLRPFRWQWIFLTFLLPVIPFLVLWDGLVSCLRIYSVPELHELVSTLDAPGWTWDIGRIQLGKAPMHATYLVGSPVSGATG